MQELFSCRNCIHNPGQGLNIGKAQGYCVRHESLIDEPADTTCKYHHRKDMPHFVVDEARSEHAAEFAHFSGLARLSKPEPLRKVFYSEKYAWDYRQFDPIMNSLASYYKAGKAWVFIQTYAGGIDGRHALVHSCLTRRYLDNCDTWKSSYRLVLALVDEMKQPPMFAQDALNISDAEGVDVVREDAAWEVFFSRLVGLQEYGWHAGVEELMWASDGLNGSLSALDWDGLGAELATSCPNWTDIIIKHAQENEGYFTHQPKEGDE
jgi:hypothetical protein